MTKQAFTIKDIAKKAGVSTATVSRVLNKQGNVSDKISKIIFKIVDETGFVLNQAAKGLRSNRTGTIGIIVSDLLNSYDVEILKGIESVAHAADYRTIICDCDNVINQRRDIREKEYLKILYKGSVDGIILVHTHLSPDDFIELKKHNYNFSVLGVNLEQFNIPSIVVDKVQGAYIGVRHLFEHGYSRIACIYGREQIDNDLWRINGYYKALKEFGEEIDEHYMECGYFTIEKGAAAFERLMRLPTPPRAVFCGNDEMAIGALKAARNMSIKIPDDVAIIGYDDIHLCDYTSPTLTSVRQPKHEMGVMLCERLIQSIEKNIDHFPAVHIKPQLIIRESCGCPQKLI